MFLCTTFYILAVFLSNLALAHRKVPFGRPGHFPPSRNAVNKRTSPGDKKVIIQMFQWNFDSIAAECEAFIGPAGYGFVEVGSPAEHINGTQWWTTYQPVSHKIISRFGTRDQFSGMVERCNAVGVNVLVDAVINHMSGSNDASVGFGGSNFSHYDYPPALNYSDFHHCTTSNNDIQDWNNMYQRFNCELENLADPDTGAPYVQQLLASYLNDLISMGVAGFRVDASSIIDPNDLAKIIALLSKPVYIQQEGPGAPNYLDMIKNGDYQEFKVSETLNSVFRGSDLTSLMTINGPPAGWTPSNSAVVFVANHDRERGGGLSYKDSQLNVLAHVWLLGYNYGTPEVLSSYQFTNNDAGAPNGGYGTCSGTTGSNGWNCQHRWPAVAAMVDFYRQTYGTPITSYVGGNSKTQIAWGRGNAGFVAINNGQSPWVATFATTLPDGQYCEILHGKRTGNDCPGLKIIIASGKFSVTVPKQDAVAIYTSSIWVPSVTVAFNVTAETNWGESIFVVGSISQIGDWDPTKAIALAPTSYPVWAGNVTGVPGQTSFEYKYIKKAGGNVVEWEPTANRQMTTGLTDTARREIWAQL